MKKEIEQNKGITLVALVITIVVMLILVAVSVSIVVKSNLIGTAEKAVDKYNRVAEEEGNSGVIEIDGKKYNSIEDYMAGKDKAVNISTLVGKGAVAKNTKAVDAYENKITIPKGFKVLAHNPTSSTGAVTYTYSGDTIPAVQDGIVIENETDGNQFVWVPVGEIKNKDNTTNTITLGRYSDFTAKNGVYTPLQSAKDYAVTTLEKIKAEDSTATKYKVGDYYYELNDKSEGVPATDSTARNATARDLKTFIETSLANGGYYIARFEASGTMSKIESKYGQEVINGMVQEQLSVAKVAREMYGDSVDYASDLVNSYAWDTAIIFIQTYSTKTDASSYASKNNGPTDKLENAGLSNDKYCNIWDMSGNASELTTEYSTYFLSDVFEPCVVRGGGVDVFETRQMFVTSGRYSDTSAHYRCLSCRKYNFSPTSLCKIVLTTDLVNKKNKLV